MKEQETAERRQVTILHADIVNSTALVDRLDPEDVMGIMQKYLDTCRAIINEYHGVLAGYTGDGFEAYFGYPNAREDSAAEAVNAALQVARLLASRDSGLPIECRLGVATGRVVVDQPGIQGIGRNVLAFGVTPTLAARLQQSADPGSILIDEATMKLCEGKFAFRSVGSVPLKGFDDQYQVWEVVEPLQPGRRFILSGLSAFVGRQAELQFLLSRWQSLLSGEGQVVVIHGEPGMGKSRLVYELQKSLPSNGGAIFQFQCLSQFASTPLHPWIQSVQRFAGVTESDSVEVKLAKVADYLHRRLGFGPEIVAICARLMGLSPTEPAERSLHHMPKLQAALVDHLIATSRIAPLFLLVEDIQWIDASTMNLLQALADVAGGERILLIMTCRSGKVPSFNHPYVTLLSLAKLGSNSVMELIDSLASSSSRTFDRTVTEKIRQKSDGNPLFVEELTKHYMELATSDHLDAADARNDDLVPKLLQGSLMERIDNAGKCKEVAQLASVIEKEFDREILADISEADTQAVQEHLDTLAELRIIRRLHLGKRVFYEFSHALLRDAVYSSLLKPTRRRTHRKIAEYFARDRGAARNVPAEIIAYHYECAGDRENAFRYWLAAGQHALQSGATEEASSLFEKASKMASAIGETPENLADIATMYLSYGLALNASRGVGANPISYFRKAEELGLRLQNTELTLEALDWQFGLHFNAGELLESGGPAQKMKQLGTSLEDATAIASGCQGLGMTQFMLGNFPEARKEFEFGLRAGEGVISGEHCFPSMSLSYYAWTLFVLGHAAEAVACIDRAIESARQESSHALATALCNCCYVYLCMGSREKVYDLTAELVEHTRKYGEQMYLRRGMIMRGWADCVGGGGEEAIETMVKEIDHLLRSKEEIELTLLLGMLADLQIRYSRYDDASSSLNKALTLANANQEKFYLPEIYRLKAKLAAVDSARYASPDGLDYLSIGRSIAETQNAKVWLDRLAT